MRKIAGFLEQLFDHENFDFRFDFLQDKINVKPTQHKMQNLTKTVEKILQDNVTLLKEAYFKDLKKKFPAKLSINLQTLQIDLQIKDGLAIYSKFLSKIFESAVRNYNLNNFRHNMPVISDTTGAILKEYFSNHGWKIDKEVCVKEIKSAEQLQIVFSQIYHILDDKTDLQQHITNWKNFFKA